MRVADQPVQAILNRYLEVERLTEIQMNAATELRSFPGLQLSPHVPL